MPFITDFKSKRFEMPIPESFQDSFFEDRRRVAARSRDYAEKHQGTDNNLTGLKDGTMLWGASTVEENYLLEQIVENYKPTVVVEIGLYRGQTALTLNRALARHCKDAHYFGFDISEASIAITRALLESQKFPHRWETLFESFSGALPTGLRPDFVLIDGDHSFAGAARDLVASYNLLKVPGVIAMHDVGSPNWGFTHQPPGVLFHEVFPKVAGAGAEISWLDSMCRDLTMRMLSPVANARHHYCEQLTEARLIGGNTMRDTIEGWGGMGLIEKRSADHQIKLEDILALAPVSTPADPKPLRKSIFSRALRKAADLIP